MTLRNRFCRGLVAEMVSFFLRFCTANKGCVKNKQDLSYIVAYSYIYIGQHIALISVLKKEEKHILFAAALYTSTCTHS